MCRLEPIPADFGLLTWTILAYKSTVELNCIRKQILTCSSAMFLQTRRRVLLTIQITNSNLKQNKKDYLVKSFGHSLFITCSFIVFIIILIIIMSFSSYCLFLQHIVPKYSMNLY